MLPKLKTNMRGKNPNDKMYSKDHLKKNLQITNKAIKVITDYTATLPPRNNFKYYCEELIENEAVRLKQGKRITTKYK